MSDRKVLAAYIKSVGALSLLCLALLGLRVAATGSTRYLFIPGNLALAWASLLSSLILIDRLKHQRWLAWQNLVLSALWLFLLPNAWYVLTDFLHVYATGEISQLYDIVLISTLVLNGFILGLTSLFLVHRQLTKKLSFTRTYWLVEAVILVTSFGVYLGRALRWNSWDILANPIGVVVNVSDRILDPLGHQRALNITGLFFVLLSVTYFGFYNLVQVLAASKKQP